MMRTAMLTVLASVLMSFNAFAADDVAALKARIAELEAQVAAHDAERKQTAKHLATFDELDLVAFNNRDMKRLAEIHAEDVKVYNPDGSLTTPYAGHHDKELEFLFDKFNWKIPEHIVGFGHGEWTAGVSISTGKWVKPITLPDGRVLEPTGKEFTIRVATLARWKDGRIVEEHLFWDNAHLNRQIGLGE